MLDRLVNVLSSEGNLSAEEVADVLWLASIRYQRAKPTPDEESPIHQDSVAGLKNLKKENLSESSQGGSEISTTQTAKSSTNLPLDSTETKTSFQAGIFPKSDLSSEQTASPFDKEFQFPNAPAFREPLSFMRALRPLLRQQPVHRGLELDESATVSRIVDEKIWMPVFKPLLEPWLDLAFVVEESPSMLVWRQTILELRHFLKNYGLFRDVRTWGLLTDESAVVHIRQGFGTAVNKQTFNTPRELLEPEGRRLILVISDCLSPIWQTGQVISALGTWSNHSPMALVQMLPEWLWDRTHLRQASSIYLKGLAPGVPNRKLKVIHKFPWLQKMSFLDQPEAESSLSGEDEIKVPILTLEPHLAMAWSRMLSGQGGVLAAGFLFEDPETRVSSTEERKEVSSKQLPRTFTAQERVDRFRLTASFTARRLAGLLAASPVISLPVIRLIQETLLPESRQMHVAEILLGGLVRPTEPIQVDTHPDAVTYEFIAPEIRSKLLESTPVTDTVSVLSRYIQAHFGESLKTFVGRLERALESDEAYSAEEIRPFATVSAEVLKRRGLRYAEFVNAVEAKYPAREELKAAGPLYAFSGFPPLQDTEYESSTIVLLDGIELLTQQFEVAEVEISIFQTFEFVTAKLERQQKQPGLFQRINPFRRNTEWVINQQTGEAQCLIESLNEAVTLEMVLIPPGEFMMGAALEEQDSRSSEQPQHKVTLREAFLMGRYPVTQEQWQAVAALPQISRELKAEPSEFKGDKRPVERVSGEDAKEFCDRLSQLTEREYRLPSEAEWEYGCRAGTTTPFHFGETISAELANYNANYTYGEGVKGKYRKQTTPVGSFNVANAFGLYDMHGNVWEWCEDDWHENYQDQDGPTDGRAWLSGKSGIKVIRGGSWLNDPIYCRSAYRGYAARDVRSNDIGFRVVCVVPKTT